MFYPRVIASNQAKVAKFRIQEKETSPHLRYPLGRFPMQVDVSFGGTSRRNGVLQINGPEGVQNSWDKIRTKNIWAKHAIPQTVNYKLVTDFVETGKDGSAFLLDQFLEHFEYPMVAKLRRGEKGEGFTYIKSDSDLESFLRKNIKCLKNYFFEDMVVFDKEYRFHVSPWIDGKLMTYNYTYLGEAKKYVRKNGLIHITQKLIKNEAYSAGVRHTNRAGSWDPIVTTENIVMQPWMEEAIQEAVKAIKVLKLDFGFVDVGYNSTTGVYTFFESGSNPELSAVESTCYLEALPHIILYKGASKGLLDPNFVFRQNAVLAEAKKAKAVIQLTAPTPTVKKIVLK